MPRIGQPRDRQCAQLGVDPAEADVDPAAPASLPVASVDTPGGGAIAARLERTTAGPATEDSRAEGLVRRGTPPPPSVDQRTQPQPRRLVDDGFAVDPSHQLPVVLDPASEQGA